MHRSSRRRFLPTLDQLCERLAPSGAICDPLDPVLDGWNPTPPPPPVVSPLDPVLVGWNPPTQT